MFVTGCPKKIGRHIITDFFTPKYQNWYQPQKSCICRATLLTSVLSGFLGVLSLALSLTVAVSTLGVKSLVESWVGSAALGSI